MSKGNTQLEIYKLLSEDGLSVKLIAERRQTSTQSVYKIIKKLRESGRFSKRFKPYSKDRGTMQPLFKGFGSKKPLIRLHGQQFRVKIVSGSEKYLISKNKCNILKIDGSTVCLHHKSISIFNRNSYFGVSELEALGFASEYLNKLFWLLEDRFNIIILKSGYNNIKCVRSHYAETRNGLSQDLHKKNVKLSIRSRADGKVWFIIDNSFNLHEAETTHPVDSADDMFIMRAFFNDLRGNPGILLPSQLNDLVSVNHRSILNQQNSIKATNKVLNDVSKLLKSVGLTLKDLIEGKIIPKPFYNNDDSGGGYETDKDSEADYFG